MLYALGSPQQTSVYFIQSGILNVIFFRVSFISLGQGISCVENKDGYIYPFLCLRIDAAYGGVGSLAKLLCHQIFCRTTGLSFDESLLQEFLKQDCQRGVCPSPSDVAMAWQAFKQSVKVVGPRVLVNPPPFRPFPVQNIHPMRLLL